MSPRVQQRITFKLISPVWTTIAEKQHSLEKLHNFLLHKNGVRYRDESPSPPPPPPLPQQAAHTIPGSMIETADASRNSIRNCNGQMSPSATAFSASNNYLTTAMLLSSQSCQNYLGQAVTVKSESRLAQSSGGGDTQLSSSPSPPPQMISSASEPVQIIGRMATGNGSPFLLKHTHNSRNTDTDSQRGSSNGGQSPISATALNAGSNSLFTIDSILAPKSTSNPSSPQSPSSAHSPTPVRPTRVPGLLHHPGLHLSHLAAAAASGFGATSDFLGE